MPELSAVLIVKNESERLEACLKSIRPATDEIIVVDTGSTDNSMSIAKACGARVIQEEWRNNFAEARNRAIKEATGRFIIWFDADDILPAESIPPLKTLLLADSSAWTTIVDNLYEGRVGQSFRQTRLFPNGKNILFEGRVHETLGRSIGTSGLSIRHSNVRILHTGYNTKEARAAKATRNHALLEIEILDHPDEPAVLMEIGNSFHQRGEYGRAISFYEKILSLPDSRKVQPEIFLAVNSLIGVSKFESGDIGGAEKHFLESIKTNPDAPTPYFYLAKIAIYRNDLATLVDMSKKLISIPESVGTVASDYPGMVAHAYGWLGNLLLVRNDMAGAALLFAESDKRNLPPSFNYKDAITAADKANLPDIRVRFEKLLHEENIKKG